MEKLKIQFVIIFSIFCDGVFSESFSVKISTETHINEVDSKFLSFTVDPKYLFTANDIYNSKECVCMASALTPAYIRIAGPTTTNLSFKNNTITYQKQKNKKITLKDLISNPIIESGDEFRVTFDQWKRFASWGKRNGFDLVFALNNAERSSNGGWDLKSCNDILGVADEGDVGNVVWQLGYECQNQTIDEYINDLESLKLAVEAFPRDPKWRIVGGDIKPCLTSHSKSDFKDFVTLSNDLFDAIFLDGNSSSYELDKMTQKDRIKLLTTLSNSDTPLWLSESASSAPETELQRASSWMYSLGQAARNGFSVHFRESKEEELLRPTKSFYMALLYKNLVGERVLDVTADPASEDTFMFAHCTSLRHEPVTGAVTLFGANTADETARFSLKLSKREEGGEIMQFILGSDINGNIMVNGRAMYFEGDIRPVVKRVKPYKTLIVNLPPKSFGFWVLANTNVKACQDTVDDNLVEAETVVETKDNFVEVKHESEREKRSVDSELQTAQIVNIDSIENIENTANSETMNLILKRVENLNGNLKNILNTEQRLKRHGKVSLKPKIDKIKEKRQTRKDLSRHDEDYADNNDEARDLNENSERNYNCNDRQQSTNRRSRPGSSVGSRGDKRLQESRDESDTRPRLGLAARLQELHARINQTRQERRQNRPRLFKRHSNLATDLKSQLQRLKNREHGRIEVRSKGRSKRSTSRRKKELFENDLKEVLAANEIDIEGPKFEQIGKILHQIKEQLNTKDDGVTAQDEDEDKEDKGEVEDQFIVKTKFSDDDTSISFSEKSKNGFFKSTFTKIVDVLSDLNEKMNKIVSSVNLL